MGLFLVLVCCCVSVLLSDTLPSAPTLELMSLVSEGLGSSASVVASTRGGRPGGSIMGKAGAGLEVTVTGTTETGAIGASAAAMGTSGLTSRGGKVSDAASLKMGADSGGWRTTEFSSTASFTGMSSSATASARPFKVLGTSAGEGVRVRRGSKIGLSVLGA